MPDRHFELPAHPDLEYYRKQAKHLLHTYETGDAAAQARVADVLGDRAAERFLLSDAQFVLAQNTDSGPGPSSARTSRAGAPPTTGRSPAWRG